jgi:2-polyprenyl-6-methoxyphenol hydroxylase-like FAD-dependent oxidoreductase
MDEGNVFWLAITNTPAGGKDDPDTVREKLLNQFRDFHPYVKQLVQNSSNFIRSDLADLGTQERKWYKGPVVFLGDSIHATTPNLAQGGCQAIEDAYCLAGLLKEYDFDLSKVFPVYQRLREKKVSFIVRTSWNMGKIAHNPLLSNLMLTYLRFMPKIVTVKLEKRLNDISYLSDIERGS